MSIPLNACSLVSFNCACSIFIDDFFSIRLLVFCVVGGLVVGHFLSEEFVDVFLEGPER